MNKRDKILITGSNGLVGSAVVGKLKHNGYKNIFTIDKKQGDLRNYEFTYSTLGDINPDYVINCAATVGGLPANIDCGGEFLYDNLMIQANVIECSRILGVKKLLQIGSSSCYPWQCPVPTKEEHLLSSSLGETDIGYSIAKISGVVMCRMYRKQYGCNFISVMPANLYGVNDNFNVSYSRVVASAIRRIYDAMISGIKQVTFYGTGLPRREFVFIDDMADALLFLMDNYNGESHINIGTGQNVSIATVIKLIVDIMGYKGTILWDSSYPNGIHEKLLDVSRINALGWKSKTSLAEGLKITIDWFKNNQNIIRL